MSTAKSSDEYRQVPGITVADTGTSENTAYVAQSGQPVKSYNPYASADKVVIDPHLGGSFEFNLKAPQAQISDAVQRAHIQDLTMSGDPQHGDVVVSTLQEISQNSQPNIYGPPPINKPAPEAPPVVETALPLIDVEMQFEGSPFSAEASFHDIFEDATQKWLFLVYYNNGPRISKTKLSASDLPLIIKLKNRGLGYKVDAKEPIIADFSNFSFYILKIIDQLVTDE